MVTCFLFFLFHLYLQVGTHTITPFDPNPLDSNNDWCVRLGAWSGTPWVDYVPLSACQNTAITVNNINNGNNGVPLSPGYWSNWNECTGGGQADAAARNDACDPSEGRYCLLEDVIATTDNHGKGPITIGLIIVDTCEEGVELLKGCVVSVNNAVCDGKIPRSDVIRKLARALMAAKLNINSGACDPSPVGSKIDEAQALLAALNFNGASYSTPTAPQLTEAKALADYLDAYNNHDANDVCNLNI